MAFLCSVTALALLWWHNSTDRAGSVDFVAMKLDKVNFWLAERCCLFVIASWQKLFLLYFNNKKLGNVNWLNHCKPLLFRAGNKGVPFFLKLWKLQNSPAVCWPVAAVHLLARPRFCKTQLYIFFSVYIYLGTRLKPQRVLGSVLQCLTLRGSFSLGNP